MADETNVVALFCWVPQALTVTATEDNRVVVTRGQETPVVMYPEDPMSTFRALVGHITLHGGIGERGAQIMAEAPGERASA